MKRISLTSAIMKTDGRLGTRGEEKMEWVLAWHLQAPSSELNSLLSAPAQGEHAATIARLRT